MLCPSFFSDLGTDPRRQRLLSPKSAQHFYGAFAPIAGEVTYMAVSGAVAPDPRQIPYRRLHTSNTYRVYGTHCSHCLVNPMSLELP
jgi:microcystin degradation protein MlrC